MARLVGLSDFQGSHMNKWAYRKEHHLRSDKPWKVYAARGTILQKLAEFNLEAGADALLAHLNREE